LLTLAALASAIAVSSALAGSSAVSAPSGQSQASTSPGTNGRIAFKRYSDAGRSTGAIFTTGVDGAGQQQVTHPQAGVVDDQPDWSADGSSIAFSRCAPDLPCAIYTVKPDGSDETRVTACPGSGQGVDANCEDGQWGSFLPDGKRVVYTRSSGNVRHFTGYDQIEHSEIVVNDVGGANPRVLISSRPYEGDYWYPAFSPDGRWIVFAKSGKGGEPDIFVMRANGSGIRPVTRTPLWDSAPDWGNAG
jgi:Tol biopolymer transport system component